MYFPDYGKVLFNNYTTKNGDKQAPLVAAQLDNQNVGTWIDQQMNMIKFRKIHQDKDDENKVFFYFYIIGFTLYVQNSFYQIQNKISDERV